MLCWASGSQSGEIVDFPFCVWIRDGNALESLNNSKLWNRVYSLMNHDFLHPLSNLNFLDPLGPVLSLQRNTNL